MKEHPSREWTSTVAFAALPVGRVNGGHVGARWVESSDDERARYTTKPNNGRGRETYDRGVVERCACTDEMLGGLSLRGESIAVQASRSLLGYGSLI